VLALLTCGLVGATRYVRLNLSPSVPVGLYRLASVPQTLARGDLVVLPRPASMRQWVHQPLLKPIAAIAGDQVCGRDGRLVVRGADYGPIYTEVQAVPLPHLEGCLLIPDGMVFVASREPKSIDSRYIGAQAHPLLTWRSSYGG
jgi:type IV secretory pathway protease TraF